MHVVRHNVRIVTAADGSGTGYTPVCNGRVLNVIYIKPQTGGYSDGVDVDVEAEDSGLVIWSQDSVNASATIAPRQATHTTAGVEAVYATDGEVVNDFIYLANERIKISVADGGDGGVGDFIVLVG